MWHVHMDEKKTQILCIDTDLSSFPGKEGTTDHDQPLKDVKGPVEVSLVLGSTQQHFWYDYLIPPSNTLSHQGAGRRNMMCSEFRNSSRSMMKASGLHRAKVPLHIFIQYIF